MDGITQTLTMWGKLGLVAGALFAGVILFSYARRVWNFSGMLSPFSVLGISLVVVVSLFFYIIGGHYGYGAEMRAAFFVLLYLWSAVGMLFFAARSTHSMKLCMGLVSQAGILYALFCLT